LIYADVLGVIRSRGGIFKERPRSGKAGRRGVVGLSLIALSSCDLRFSGSRNFGDGDRVAGPPSDRERAFEGDCDAVLLSSMPHSSAGFTPSTSIGGGRFSFNWPLNIFLDRQFRFRDRAEGLFSDSSWFQHLRPSGSVMAEQVPRKPRSRIQKVRKFLSWG